jgi:hypothetical protein
LQPSAFFEKNPNPFQGVVGVLRTESGHVLEQVTVCINEAISSAFDGNDGVEQLLIRSFSLRRRCPWGMAGLRSALSQSRYHRTLGPGRVAILLETNFSQVTPSSEASPCLGHSNRTQKFHGCVKTTFFKRA